MQKKRIRIVYVSILIVTLVYLLFPKSISSADIAQKDFTVPANYSLGVCKTAIELDCVEAVGLLDDNGGFTPSKLSADLPQISPHQDPNGNEIYPGETIWESSAGLIHLVATLDSPVAKGCNGTCAALRFHVAVADPLTTKVRFIFRTSWLKPMNIQMKALDSDYTYQKINGGVRWTMEGKGMPYSDYSTEWNAKNATGAQADFDGTLFDFYIHHAGKSAYDSFWDPVCADVGFTVQSHNTNATGDPQWDQQSQSLLFSIFAPHKKANGDLNTGYFKFWTSDAFMDCKFPKNNLTKASKLTIEIVSEDGDQSVATTGVSNKNGMLYFFASGFHFSSPRILIKADTSSVPTLPPSATPSQIPSTVPTPLSPPSATRSQIPSTSPKPPLSPMKPGVRLSVISCIKGKTVKKVTGTNPQCPLGYKKITG
jgi:hypothetical protein